MPEETKPITLIISRMRVHEAAGARPGDDNRDRAAADMDDEELLMRFRVLSGGGAYSAIANNRAMAFFLGFIYVTYGFVCFFSHSVQLIIPILKYGQTVQGIITG